MGRRRVDMITEKEVKNAVNTIIEYCEQRYKENNKFCACENCAIGAFCDELYKRISDDCEGWEDLRDYQVFYNEEEKGV